jgi:hypothetical protein
MKYHRHNKLTVRRDDVEIQLGERRVNGFLPVREIGAGVAFGDPLGREQQTRQPMKPRFDREINQNERARDPCHLGEQLAPPRDVREKPDPGHEIEGAVLEWERPQRGHARRHSSPPMQALLAKPRETPLVGAVDDDPICVRAERLQDLTVSPPHIQNRRDPPTNAAEQLRNHLALPVEEISSDRAVEAAGIAS